MTGLDSNDRTRTLSVRDPQRRRGRPGADKTASGSRIRPVRLRVRPSHGRESSRLFGPHVVRELSCKGWPQEAALRMLMNNLDPDVAERPQDLVVYGGTGKAARSWPDYHTIVSELRRLRARPDTARAIRPRGRRVSHARRGTTCPDRELESGRSSGRRGSTSASSSSAKA